MPLELEKEESDWVQYLNDEAFAVPEENWTIAVTPLQQPTYFIPGLKLPRGWDQEIEEATLNIESNPRDGITWHAQQVSYVEIERRFSIQWKPPLGFGAYGKVVEV